jgi:tetratricopeptide (TPR) repeat protein/DNA-binding SARP family transcriptional activator
LLLDGGPDDTWAKPRERAVLATLVVHAGQVVPVDTLLRWVWPQDKPVPLDPRATLDTYISRLRRALARLPSSASLRAGPGGYRLDVDRTQVDYHQFRSLLEEARTFAGRDPGRVVGLVECALWLWRGLPLADLASAPAHEWREGVLRNEWLAAHVLRVAALIDLDRCAEALASLDELQADFPDHADLLNLRLTALYGLRRHADATCFYLATWRRLRAAGDEVALHQFRQHHAALASEHTVPEVPLPTLVPNQLPRAVDDFVGRAAELAALDEAASNLAGVVVIEGVGGVGKTTLAVHWARRMRARFPDGQLFANLAGTADRARVDPAVVIDDFLVALGQPPDPVLTREQRARLLRLLLTDRRLLVVLDDVHDTEHVADLVGLLPSCLVVVTSRRQLSELADTAGARRFSLPPMGPEESAELLAVHLRGRAVGEQRLNPCGGLPLTITVLAKDLVRNGRNRLVPVGADDATATPVDACLMSAYRALAAPERRLFRLLALHQSANITTEAAYACDGRTPTATMRSLIALAEVGLLAEPDELDRVRRHDVLAEFAARLLDREEPALVRHTALVRLLDRCVASANQVARATCARYVVAPNQRDEHAALFTDTGEAMAWFGRERTTLVAMIGFANAEGCHDQVWRLAEPVAAVLDELGLHVESGTVREVAVDSARATAARAVEAAMSVALGRTRLALGDHEAAARHLEAALLVDDGDTVLGPALRLLGQSAMLRGDTPAALALYDRAVTVAERVGDRQNLCWAHHRLGQALRATDQHDEALARLGRAQELACELGDGATHAASLVEIGAIHRERGDHAAAFAYCEQALAIAEAIPDLAVAGQICVTLSQISSEHRQFASAVAYGRRGVLILQGTQDLSTRASVLAAYADALYGSGEPHEAALTWRRAAVLYDHAGGADHAALLRRRAVRTQSPGTVPPARTGSPVPVEIEPLLAAIPKSADGRPD